MTHRPSDEDLVHLYMECGYSADAIARRYDNVIHRTTVLRHLHRLGIEVRDKASTQGTRIPTREMAQIVFMYDRLGWSCRRIGEYYGLAHTTIWHRLKNAGVTMRPSGGVRQENDANKATSVRLVGSRVYE